MWWADNATQANQGDRAIFISVQHLLHKQCASLYPYTTIAQKRLELRDLTTSNEPTTTVAVNEKSDRRGMAINQVHSARCLQTKPTNQTTRNRKIICTEYVMFLCPVTIAQLCFTLFPNVTQHHQHSTSIVVSSLTTALRQVQSSLCNPTTPCNFHFQLVIPLDNRRQIFIAFAVITPIPVNEQELYV